MTPVKQRIAIAEFEGWKCIDVSDVYGPLWWEKDGRPSTARGLPDYTNNLNAIHEAEMRLTDEQYGLFHYHLVRSRNDKCLPVCRCNSATAAERSEALLKSIGKWQE